MMQGNLAPKYKQTPRHYHNRYQHNNLKARLINLHQKRHLKGERSQLFLNKLEKIVLIVGIVVSIGLMLILVSTKITNDVYQHQVITVNAKMSKYHNFNNDLRQKTSDLQNNGRLNRIAHKDHLRFSSRDVRNVK